MKNLCDGMEKMVVADVPGDMNVLSEGMKVLGITDAVNGVGTKDLVSNTGQGEYKGTIKTSMNFMELLIKNSWSDMMSNLGEGEMLDSREVQTEMIQDYGAPMEIIGFDVDALYPSLDWENTERVIKDAIVESSIKWEDIDIMEGCRYIALNWDGNKCRKS